MKKYPDSKAGVKTFLKDFYSEAHVFAPDTIMPDPYVDGVWLAIDSKNEKVEVIYLNSNDAEEIPYKSSNWRDYLR